METKDILQELMDYANAFTSNLEALWQIIGALRKNLGYYDTTPKRPPTPANTPSTKLRELCKSKEEYLRKLKYGQGSIVLRTTTSKGRTYHYYQGKYRLDGKTFYCTAKTYNDCYLKLANIRKHAQSLMPATISKDTFIEYIKEYLNTYKKPFVSKSTYDGYFYTLNNNVPDETLQKKIRNVQTAELQRLINKAAESHPRASRTLYDLFTQVMRRAYAEGIIKRNIEKLLIKPKQDPKEEQPLTAAQQKQLMQVASERQRFILQAYIWSGCRRSELLTLKWTDISNNKQTLLIKGTKTDTSVRTVPIFVPLQQVLDQLPRTDKRIFPYSVSTIRRMFENLNEKVDFHLTPKTLRHTFNQNLTEMGVSDLIRAKWMGHAKPTTTKRVYTHVTDNLEQQEITKIKNQLPNT